MRVLAIDYGDARTGIAISDAFGMLAGYTCVINSWKQEQVVEEIKRLVKEHNVDEIVLGYPKNMNNTLGEKALKCQELAEILKTETNLNVVLWDERLTTVDAHKILSKNGRKTAKHRKNVDAVAASLILEGYLNFKKV